MEHKKEFNVIVEGNIGSGKTTFLDYFQQFEEVCVLPEPVEMWRNCNGQNLLALLYEDIKTWAFTFQSYVLLTMAQQHTRHIDKSIRLLERSIYSARHCFIESMVTEGYISDFPAMVLNDSYNYLSKKNVAVDLIVYLQTTPQVVYNRMMERNRNEEKKVSLEYLKTVHEAHENWLIKKTVGICPAPVIVVNANLDRVNILKEYDRIAPCVLNKKIFTEM